MTFRNHKKIYRISLSALCMALGLVLPFLTGQIPEIGNLLLPMHLPIFLCGILCGIGYGAAVGFVTPLLRSLLFSRPILYPAAVSMAFELAAYGALVALFVKLLRRKTVLRLYASLIAAMLGGRVVWAITRIFLLALDDIPFSFAIFFSEGFATALPGILIQLVLVPALVVAIDPEYRKGFGKKKQPMVAKMTVEEAVETLVQRIIAAKANKTQLIVAIDGRAASGKTTLSQAVSAKLCECGLLHSVIHTDDYLLPFDRRTEARMAEVGGHFDYERLASEVVLPFEQGNAITVRRFSCADGEILDGITLPISPILIVEGAYSMHPKLGLPYDLSVFCEVDREIQRRRVKARDPARAEAFFSEWIPREERYFAAVRPDLSADLRMVIGN
ncbi:MAG: ECF transporter S component [Clostridia bacterium]|nr:ECF transporter S component [Clostridia bacterium]